MKSDELFDKLADQRENDANALVLNERSIYVVPPVPEIRGLWDSLNKELGDVEKLKEADFVIKKSNEFYFSTMYLKAAMLQDCDKRCAVLSGLTQAHVMGSKDSFIRKEYKELKKRLSL